MRPEELYAACDTIAGPETAVPVPAPEAVVSSAPGIQIAVERPSRPHVPGPGHSHLKGCRP